MAPSPAGEGWGEENKIKALSTSPHPTFSLWRRLLDLCRYLCSRGEAKKIILSQPLRVGTYMGTLCVP